MPEIHVEDALGIVGGQKKPVLVWWFVLDGKKYEGLEVLEGANRARAIARAEDQAYRKYERVTTGVGA